jgi:phosphate transport system protein
MRHTDSTFEAELDRISSLVAHMSSQIGDMLEGAERALRDRNIVLARHMIDADRDINHTELAIDGLCMHILALRQPVASDLRLLMTVLKMVTDYERIGDLAKNVCERVLELAVGPRMLEDAPLLEMMQDAREMVTMVMRAFVERDPVAARAVLDSDDRIDRRYHEVLQDLLRRMKDDPPTVFEATRLQSVAKYIERIGDHATNVAEMVVFMVEGQDIRHARPPTVRLFPR